MKLALVALALALGTGACVTDDTDAVERIETNSFVTEHNVINEITFGDTDPLNVNAVVIVTGMGLPSANPTAQHIDLSTIASRTETPKAQALCAQAGNLPISDVCSSLCEDDFASRVFGANGSQQDCTNQNCVIDGQNVGVSVCR